MGVEERQAVDKTGGELNLTLIFYERNPKSCNDGCNFGARS